MREALMGVLVAGVVTAMWCALDRLAAWCGVPSRYVTKDYSAIFFGALTGSIIILAVSRVTQ